MLPVLEFIFSSFWTFLGTLLLIAAVSKGFALILAVLLRGLR